jgi:HSP20 family protein
MSSDEASVNTDRGFLQLTCTQWKLSESLLGLIQLQNLQQTLSYGDSMNTIARWADSRGSMLQDQVNRLFEDSFTRDRSGHADLATWSPAVDIYETPNELVVKADLPDLRDEDIDIRVVNNTLTIRGERKFEKDIQEDNCLRIERAYGPFMRSFSLPNTVSSENIRADYRNGVLTLHMAKREESKPKQIKISVAANAK